MMRTSEALCALWRIITLRGQLASTRAFCLRYFLFYKTNTAHRNEKEGENKANGVWFISFSHKVTALNLNINRVATDLHKVDICNATVT